MQYGTLRTILAGALCAGLGMAPVARAQSDFPNKPVKLVIPFAPGGSADIAFVPKRAGSFAFRCTHFLHATLGMTGNAVVE